MTYKEKDNENNDRSTDQNRQRWMRIKIEYHLLGKKLTDLSMTGCVLSTGFKM